MPPNWRRPRLPRAVDRASPVAPAGRHPMPPAAEPPDRPAPPALTRREWLGTTVLGLAIAGAAGLVAWWTAPRASRRSGPLLDRPRQLVPFEFTDRTGRTVNREELRGHLLVVSFLFTSCSLSCRVVNERMAALQTALGDAPDVRLVSLTVDPRTDTPATLAKFAAQYRADTNRWLFLTGPKPELYRVIEESFLARSRELETLIPGGFENLDRLLLVDRAGRVRQAFDGQKPSSVGDLLAAIDTLRAEPPPPATIPPP